MKATAVRCLDSLDLGLVGPKLIGPNCDRPEILNDRLVEVYAREDLGLSKEDFNAYVSVVKDLDILVSSYLLYVNVLQLTGKFSCSGSISSSQKLGNGHLTILL